MDDNERRIANLEAQVRELQQLLLGLLSGDDRYLQDVRNLREWLGL